MLIYKSVASLSVLPVLTHERMVHLVVIELFGGLFWLLRGRERLLCLRNGGSQLGGTHVDLGDLCVQQPFFTQHVCFFDDIRDGLGRIVTNIAFRLFLLILDTHIAGRAHLFGDDLLHFTLAYILVRIWASSYCGYLVDFITSTFRGVITHSPIITCLEWIEFTLGHEQAVLLQLDTALLMRLSHQVVGKFLWLCSIGHLYGVQR